MRTTYRNPARRCGASLAVLIVATLGALTRAQVTRSVDVATSPDGVPIAYEAAGEGTPLVLVHGWSCDRSYWKEQLPALSREFTVVAVDLAGHGESGLGRRDWTMGAYGGDVAAVVRKLGLEGVILVGHSMGGDVIVEAARRLKGRVKGLIWVDAYRELGRPRTAEQRESLVAPLRTNFTEATRGFVRGMFPPAADPDLVARVAADMSSAPPEVALPSLESAFAYADAVSQALKELGLPVVAINADFRPTDVASLNRHGVEVVLMPGVGHFPMMEAPEPFNDLLRTAIGKVAR